MERIGVRELRQNASKYLDRVKRGESIEVTERGVPIAVLGPMATVKRSRVDELIEQGRMTAGTGELAEILARPRAPIDQNYTGPSIAQILDEQREERL